MQTLRRGHRGDEVRLLQRIVDLAGFYHMGIDGDFGPVTEHAVQNWQRQMGLVVDGICGPATWRSFETHVPLASTAGAPYPAGPHFMLSEFACRHCQYVILRWIPELVDGLEDIRAYFGGRPLIINSPYRCPPYNAATPNAAPDSWHKYGRAVDIAVAGVAASRVADYAERMGWRGVGRYAGFTHLDIGDKVNRFKGGY